MCYSYVGKEVRELTSVHFILDHSTLPENLTKCLSMIPMDTILLFKMEERNSSDSINFICFKCDMVLILECFQLNNFFFYFNILNKDFDTKDHWPTQILHNVHIIANDTNCYNGILLF